MAGIYIHIPFCKKKCNYCNFFSVTSLKNKPEFIDALLKEIEIQKNYLNKEIIKTIYFGGGTPSLLSQDEINKIIDKLYKYHTIDKDAEITLEANPDDLTKNKIKKLKNTPVNRLSIGVQSFFDYDLTFLGRIHNAKQSYNAIKYSQDAGFDNLNIDLIYSIPNLSNKNWKENLNISFSLQIPHISAYNLTIEEKTLLYILIKKSKIRPVSEQQSIEQYKILLKLMKKNNYIHYEISNFCKKDHFSKHNTNYWLHKKYLGLGPCAHSFNIISRQWNIANISKYMQSIQNKTITFEKEILSLNQQYNEYILTLLRTMWGCDIDFIKNTYGKKYYNNFLKESLQYIKNNPPQVNRIKNTFFLTQNGKLFADKIASDLFVIDN
jgi:oxygen-independent coproporphyrinogen-3 oxidase